MISSGQFQNPAILFSFALFSALGGQKISMNGQITDFIKHHYRHFNAAALIDAAEGYKKHLENGGKMMITLAGAMSTAELGLSLAEMSTMKYICRSTTK